VVYPNCTGQCVKKKENGIEEVCWSLCQCIEKAKREWQEARAMFNEVTEKEHIDSLIYKINACERKYIYLLNLAKNEKLNVFPGLR